MTEKRADSFRLLSVIYIGSEQSALRANSESRRGLSPKVLKPIRRQLGVTHRVLDITMAQVSLQSPGVMALVCERKATGVPKHVGVSLEAQFGNRSSALYHPGKAGRGERRATLRGEHER